MRFGTFGRIMVKVETPLILVFAINLLAVTLVVWHLVRHEKLTRMAPYARGAVPDTGAGDALPEGRSLEEYVHAGLDELRIMLVQAARRRPS